MQHSINHFREIGVDFRFGYERRPLASVSQVLWFRLEASAANTSRALSHTYFWIEHVSGELVALALNDLECPAEVFIPTLAYSKPIDSDRKSLTEQLRMCWLFPPRFCAVHIPNALICPNKAFLWLAIKQHLSAMLGMPYLSENLEERIERFLLNSQREMIDREGLVIEKYACTPQHEFSPSIELMEGVTEFLDLVNQFKVCLSDDILGLFDFYAPLLDARTHTVENYNTARSWSDMQRRNRIQAIKAFPWLFHELGLRTGGPDFFHETANIATLMSQSIVEAIDLGHPLIPLLAKRYNIHKHTLRYARTLLNLRHRTPECIPAMLWLLDGITPAMRPTGESDLEALNNAINFIAHWQHETDRVYVKEVAQTLLKEGVSGFRALLRRHCPSHNPDDPFNDLGDFLADYAQKQDGALITQELADSLVKDWIMEAGLVSLLVESERWHTAWWMRENEIEQNNWPPLMTTAQRIGNMMVCELSSTHLLVEEGRAMRHCIASYASLCQAGKSFIFSLRNLDGGKRRSTLNIGMDEAGRFIIREHRAFANREPDQECIDAAFQFVDSLRVIAARAVAEPLTV